ncbi:MAG: YqeG family HAD IIIA-type phosphatase [Hydrogenibacillus sp.]|nr:YqeG family HAD IIIA-type phosphatase [Hydrogenibacillus sp.]
MKRLFKPERVVDSFFVLEAGDLAQQGIRGLIVDLDNTLVPWNSEEESPEVAEHLNRLLDAGLRIVIASNNRSPRVGRIAGRLGVRHVSFARKPLPIGLRRALSIIDLPKTEVAVVGDQLLTDVLGGNLLGLRTILVRPLVDHDGWVTRVNRWVERRVLGRRL